MSFRIQAGILAGLLLAGGAFANSPGKAGALDPEGRMPAFSWNTVPRYMHVRKHTAFTPEEIEYLATFPLITFEKTTGQREFGSTEAGTANAARAVKRLNPDATILWYRNILVHYSGYYGDTKLANIEDVFLADRAGNTNLVREIRPAYDLTNKKVQAWWLAHARWVCSSKYIDGLFVDGNVKVLEERYLRNRIGGEKKDALVAAYHRMMMHLPRMLGRNKLIVANILRARFDDAGLEYLDPFDGAYIEGFEHAVKRVSRKEYVAKGIAAAQAAARSGKVIAFTIGMGQYMDTEMDEVVSEEVEAQDVSFQERFTYALALFLVCAEKYSYFMFTDGYGVDGSRSKLWMKRLPEYSRPLGPPKGPALRDGYVYQRSFRYADVTVNIEKETASIRWKRERIPLRST